MTPEAKKKLYQQLCAPFPEEAVERTVGRQAGSSHAPRARAMSPRASYSGDRRSFNPRVPVGKPLNLRGVEPSMSNESSRCNAGVTVPR